jgi:hypothetical protein
LFSRTFSYQQFAALSLVAFVFKITRAKSNQSSVPAGKKCVKQLLTSNCAFLLTSYQFNFFKEVQILTQPSDSLEPGPSVSWLNTSTKYSSQSRTASGTNLSV